jgi:hypothetical protein
MDAAERDRAQARVPQRQVTAHATSEGPLLSDLDGQLGQLGGIAVEGKDDLDPPAVGRALRVHFAVGEAVRGEAGHVGQAHAQEVPRAGQRSGGELGAEALQILLAQRQPAVQARSRERQRHPLRPPGQHRLEYAAGALARPGDPVVDVDGQAEGDVGHGERRIGFEDEALDHDGKTSHSGR